MADEERLKLKHFLNSIMPMSHGQVRKPRVPVDHAEQLLADSRTLLVLSDQGRGAPPGPLEVGGYGKRVLRLRDYQERFRRGGLDTPPPEEDDEVPAKVVDELDHFWIKSNSKQKLIRSRTQPKLEQTSGVSPGLLRGPMMTLMSLRRTYSTEVKDYDSPKHYERAHDAEDERVAEVLRAPTPDALSPASTALEPIAKKKANKDPIYRSKEMGFGEVIARRSNKVLKASDLLHVEPFVRDNEQSRRTCTREAHPMVRLIDKIKEKMERAKKRPRRMYAVNEEESKRRMSRTLSVSLASSQSQIVSPALSSRRGTVRGSVQLTEEMLRPPSHSPSLRRPDTSQLQTRDVVADSDRIKEMRQRLKAFRDIPPEVRVEAGLPLMLRSGRAGLNTRRQEATPPPPAQRPPRIDPRLGTPQPALGDRRRARTPGIIMSQAPRMFTPQPLRSMPADDPP